MTKTWNIFNFFSIVCFDIFIISFYLLHHCRTTLLSTKVLLREGGLYFISPKLIFCFFCFCFGGGEDFLAIFLQPNMFYDGIIKI